jgi:hypothetical protein
MSIPLADQPPAQGSVLADERRVQIPLDEFAQRMGISRWMAYKLAKSGELPTNRIGRLLYVPLAVLRRAEQGLPLVDPADGGDAT